MHRSAADWEVMVEDSVHSAEAVLARTVVEWAAAAALEASAVYPSVSE